MLNDFRDLDRWSFQNGRHVCRLLFHGEHYAVCPGRVSAWHRDVERFFKHHAYTSEVDIDWNYEHVAVRHNGITRGMIFQVDDWLFQKCLKP